MGMVEPGEVTDFIHHLKCRTCPALVMHIHGMQGPGLYHAPIWITTRHPLLKLRHGPDGKLMRTIGKPGAPAAGLYDPLHMNNPNGLALDSQGRLWVAEADDFPRRVSVWTAQGGLVRAFYGPTEYGGGGVLDSQDAARFFYKGMEFALDWQAGRDELRRVFARPESLLKAHEGHYSPDTPLYPAARKGERLTR